MSTTKSDSRYLDADGNQILYLRRIAHICFDKDCASLVIEDDLVCRNVNVFFPTTWIRLWSEVRTHNRSSLSSQIQRNRPTHPRRGTGNYSHTTSKARHVSNNRKASLINAQSPVVE